jgi:DNA polymerase II small subunit/DNA polymerase delta subunit B
MTAKLWTQDEVKDLVKTMKDSFTVSEALEKHNKKWKTNRSDESARKAMRRYTHTSAKDHLKPTPQKETFFKVDTKEDETIQKVINLLKSGGKNLEMICNTLDISPKKAEELLARAVQLGYKITGVDKFIALQRDIVSNPSPTAARDIPLKPLKNEIHFAVASDLHAGSIHCMKREFEDFARAAHERGVRHILIPGDLIAGMRMYRGQENELEVLGLPEVLMSKQLEILNKMMPKLDGLKYYFITGNHDLSFLNNVGLDPGERFASMRDDVVYLGQYSARCSIAGVSVELHHPDGGGAYAISYNLQKFIEAMPSGSKPQLYFCGHFHQSIYLTYRNVHAYYAGTFEKQSLYLLRKKLMPALGGWDIKVGLDADGSVKHVLSQFMPYYQAKKA